MNTSSFGVERATLIRVPATANLMIDSADRPQDISSNIVPSNFSDFQITRSQSLINGYFTRIGTTEVAFEWCFPNITPNNNSLTFTGSGGETFDMSGNFLTGLYDVSGVLNEVITLLNAGNPDYTFEAITLGNQTVIQCTDNNTAQQVPIKPVPSVLAFQLDLQAAGSPTGNNFYEAWIVECPDLRPYRYIDIVCEQLTSVQDVKDTSTNIINRDVLCRWYMCEDEPEEYDILGFPLLMGYRHFCRRRIFNPPKQIKWEQNLPVGNLRFALYGNAVTNIGTTAAPLFAYRTQALPLVAALNLPNAASEVAANGTQWLMTLQLTEG